MSYDLAVFEPRDELRYRKAFDEWYDRTTDWEKNFNYYNPENVTGPLRLWLTEFTKAFPPLNGPMAPPIEQLTAGIRTADHNVARDLIYIAFSWSDAELAYRTCFDLAKRFRVAFLDASGDEGAVWFPTENGSLEIVHAYSDE